jgi:hypothetical protein
MAKLGDETIVAALLRSLDSSSVLLLGHVAERLSGRGGGGGGGGLGGQKQKSSSNGSGAEVARVLCIVFGGGDGGVGVVRVPPLESCYLCDASAVQEGQQDRGDLSVAVRSRWPLSRLLRVERLLATGAGNGDVGGECFALAFEHHRGAGGGEEVLAWRAQTSCEELLWGLLTICKALASSATKSSTKGRMKMPEMTNVNLKELEAMAVYDGLLSKNPAMEQLLIAFKSGDSLADVSAQVAEEDEEGEDWAHEEYQLGEAALERLKWRERGQDELKQVLSDELEQLESSTIEKLIIWSEKADEAETLTSILDSIESQLSVMDSWLEEHGRPLELMQQDMVAIEGKNNALEVQWRNYQRLLEYLERLGSTLSLSPQNEAILGDIGEYLGQGPLGGDEIEAERSLAETLAAIEALEEALTTTNLGAAGNNSADHEGGGLRFIQDSRHRLLSMKESVASSLSEWLKSLIKGLATGAARTGTSGSLTGDSSRQVLLQVQRRFHGYLIDYEPLFAKLRTLDAGARVEQDLRKAYAREVGSGLLAVLINGFFAELTPRIQYGRANVSLSALPKVGIDDPPSRGPTSSGDHLTVASAITLSLEQTTPAIAREYAFFSTLFGLTPAESEDHKTFVHSELAEGFSPLRASLRRIASDISDVPDVISALAAIDDSQRTASNSNGVTTHVLLEFKGLLVQKFFKFIEDQRVWIVSQKPDARRAGILPSFARFPALVDAMQSAVRRVDPQEEHIPGEVLTAYQKLAHTLFQHLDACALGNPKYANVVRLENFYFFWKTIELRNVSVLDDFTLQASAAFEACSGQYVEWLIQYQFPQLIEFFNRVEDLVSTVGARDVSYHENRKKLDTVLRKYCEEAVLLDGLKATHTRMQKHLCSESNLAVTLWENLAGVLFAMFSRFEELCMVCYDFTMAPSAMDVRNMAAWVDHEVKSGIISPKSSTAASAFGSPRSSSALSLGVERLSSPHHGAGGELPPSSPPAPNQRASFNRGHSPRGGNRNSIAGSLTASIRRHIRKSSSGL